MILIMDMAVSGRMAVKGLMRESILWQVMTGVDIFSWLRLGGYRLGIRSKSGFYYYYAHMRNYAPGIKKGKKVKAGTLLGTMGDTGYGKEGTHGKFAVHLHFGIYRDKKGEECSLNPYDVLLKLK